MLLYNEHISEGGLGRVDVYLMCSPYEPPYICTDNKAAATDDLVELLNDGTLHPAQHKRGTKHPDLEEGENPEVEPKQNC